MKIRKTKKNIVITFANGTKKYHSLPPHPFQHVIPKQGLEPFDWQDMLTSNATRKKYLSRFKSYMAMLGCPLSADWSITKRNEKRVEKRTYTGSNPLPLLAITETKPVLAMFQLLYYNGMRPADVLALKWADIDNGFINLTPTKTGGIFRIAIAPQVELPLKGGSVYVFPNNKGLPFSANYLNLRWRKCGCDGVLYTLRHRFISDKIAKGVPIALVAHMVGHSSLDMIQKHYSSFSDDVLKGAFRV